MYEPLIKGNEISWETTNDSKRNDNAVDAQLVKAAFQMPQFAENTPQPIASVGLRNGDFAIVQLQAIKEGDIAELSEQRRQKIREQLAEGAGSLSYQLYVHDMMSRAEIKLLRK